MSPRQIPDHPAVRTVGALGTLTLFLFGTASLASDATEAPPETISWRSEYNSAYFEAKDARRLIWIQFTGPWCPNCRRMEHDSFPQPRIVQHARESFVPVKLRSDENEDLALRFNLTGLPATVIIDPSNQRILSLQQGYLGPDELDALFADAMARRDQERKRLAEQLAAAKKPKWKATRLSPHQQFTYSRIQEQGIRPDFGIFNLTAAWLSSAIKQSERPQAKQPASPATEPSLALSGYCVVSLVSTHKLVPGDKALTVDHHGKRYRFANEATRELFRKDPDQYLPVNQGKCPVAGLDREKALDGNPRFGILFRERLYLCATREDRGRFLQNPERYALTHVAGDRKTVRK